MPSDPVPPSDIFYGEGCSLTLVGDESDPTAAAKLTLKIERDLGTLKNNVTRRVLGKVTNGPPEFVGLNVVALVYDPLYVPLSSLPLLWPKLSENGQNDEPESDSEAEAAQDDSKSWMDYFPRPDPNVNPAYRMY